MAVVNVDDPTGGAIAADVAGRMEVLAVGRTGAVRWTDLNFDRNGIHGTWITPWGRRSFDLAAFFGEFSVYNAACVLAACCALGDGLGEVVDAMRELPGVPGRMQAVATRPMVFVDYAHTPEGLNAVLAAVRSHVGSGHLVAVFGCGGDRDQGKRPLMARAAESGADVVVATTDNPRSELPDRILDDVMKGFDDPDAVLRISDRREAIGVALDHAEACDVVVIAGKGHEDYQEVDGRRLPWSDAGTVAELLHHRLAAPSGGFRSLRSLAQPRGFCGQGGSSMMLWFTEYLADYVSGFGVFQYLTFRTVVSTMTALLISLLVGPTMIRKLSHHQIGQVVRDVGPETHLEKAGTPTMVVR